MERVQRLRAEALELPVLVAYGHGRYVADWAAGQHAEHLILVHDHLLSELECGFGPGRQGVIERLCKRYYCFNVIHAVWRG